MNYPVQVLGLAFISWNALKMVLRDHFDAHVYPGEDFEGWLKAKHRKRPVAVVHDRKYFKKALTSGATAVIVLADLDWLERRGVKCLDAQRDSEGGIVMVNVTPAQIYEVLKASPVFTESADDTWTSKSNPDGRCAGCFRLSDCLHEPTPISKRPCGNKWEAESAQKRYRRYSLSHLVHLALRGVKEDLLIFKPKDFWQACYALSLGQMNKSDWINRFGRPLKTAGSSKDRLQDILMWAKRYGKVLAQGQTKHPPSSLDVRLATKLCGVKKS